MQKALPVALLYGEQARSAALRGALEQLPVELVCDRDIASFSIDQLEASGARVVLLSLDDVLEDRLDEVYDQLDADRYRVIFDDAEISNGLDGWERARWQRHLAAKLCDNEDWDPPRPIDARPVDVAAATAVPAPAEAGSAADTPAFPDADEIALALGLADTPVVADGDDGGEPPAPDDTTNSTLAVEVADAPPPGTVGDEPPAMDDAAAELDFDIDFGHAPEPDEPALAPEPPPALAAASDAVAVPSTDDDGRDFTLDFDLDADFPAADEPAPQPPDNEPGEAFNDLEDARLQAELDALADADDPLAALAALATGSAAQEPGAESAEFAPAMPPAAQADPDARTAPADAPAAGSAATASDAGDGLDEPDWDALEADLNAVFDSDTLNSLDGAEDIGAAAIDALATEHIAPAAAADAPATNLSADDASAPELTDVALPTSAAAAEAPVDAPLSSASAPSWSDSSSWGLVDDDAPLPPPAIDPAAAPTSDDPANDAADAEAPAPGAAADADDAASEFKLELLDPVDYLQPEAPADVTTELFRMPSLVSQAEAVAPSVDGDDAPRDRAAAPLGRVVVLGASLGGPDAVRDFLAHLPPRLPATLLLVLHLGREFLDLMVSQLSRSCALPVHVPVQAERAAVGEVLVVPAGARIHLARDGHLRVDGADSGSDEHASMDHTMTMAAETFGADTTAIVFSGMANDAREGAQAVAAAGGQVWVQDPDSCVVSTMVDAVMQAGLAQFVGTPQALAEHLIAHLQETDDGADG